MNPIITLQHLQDAGIDLTGKDADKLLAHLNEMLEERVGAEITQSLDDTKLEELVNLQENGSDEEVGAWLQANVPELEHIVDDEIDILLGEIDENAATLGEA